MNNAYRKMLRTPVDSLMQGVSLVELMVSITVSLIMLVGIAQIYIGSKESYRINDDIRFMQEAGRFGLENLTEVILMADHWGGVESAEVVMPVSPTVAGTVNACNQNWVFNIDEGLRGVEGASSPAGLTGFQGCVLDANYVANSDVLILRYADRQAITDANAAAITANNVFVRSSVGNRGMVFEGNNGLPATIPAGLQADPNQLRGVRNYPYHVEAYYLRPCRNDGGDGECNANDDTIPTLMRLTLNGLTLTHEAVVDGVEQMQFEYGVDDNQDGNADQFVSASQVADWDEVIAVRIDMLVRTANQDTSYRDTKTYTLAGGANGLSYVPDTNSFHFRRKQMSKVVQLRNRTRS